GPVTEKERAIIQSISPHEGKYEERVDRESAEEVLLAKAADAAETAKEVEEKGEEAVRAQPRKTTSMWQKAGSAAAKAAASSAAVIIAAKVTGRKSSSNPARNAATAAAGTLATQLGGGLFGSFVRNVIGGLMR
ncbi:MAG TPA: helicase HerA-like domain-containing protein, partial [Sphingomicrobium sp.]|nr:helicase HerA-like domain-containing protein [Sphingomicrobium sp.]